MITMTKMKPGVSGMTTETSCMMNQHRNPAEVIRASVLGFAVGDALGVPVEFLSREELAEKPVTDMQNLGTHEQPAGTWSDDTSMTLCSMCSLTEMGIDYEDQMQRFEDWLWKAEYTAHGEVFDVGGTTRQAIFRFAKGTPALDCGERAEYACGNGSLMRMLPTALYLFFGMDKTKLDDEAANVIHLSSACTHAHPRCKMACGIYADVLFHLLSGEHLQSAVAEGVKHALAFYEGKPEFAQELPSFESLKNIRLWSEKQISGSGYVIHTLQAVLWCLLTTSGYSECVLKAVNLGEDTDTTAAVAGSLAGAWYGMTQIPEAWLQQLAKHDWICRLCDQFTDAICKIYIQE